MGYALILLGLSLFLAPHVLVTRREARASLVKRFGPAVYKLVFSIVSIAGLIVIGYGFARYRATDWIGVWDPPVWARHLSIPMMWLSSVAVTAAYIPGHIKRVLKHPMLVGVKIWALAHLIANGDLGSIILFGTILGWAVFDRISLKRRTDPGGPPIPIGGLTNDALAVVVGSVVFLALAYVFHPVVIGVPVFGR